MSPLRRSIYLIHGVRHSSHFGYRDELNDAAAASAASPSRSFALVYLQTVSRPKLDPEWTGLTGRAESLLDFSAAAIRNSIDSPQNQVRDLLRAVLHPANLAVYVCGYPGTIENVERLLAPLGFRPGTDIKREKYDRR